MRRPLFFCAAIAISVQSAASPVAVSDTDAMLLARKYKCNSCHALDKQIAGPSFREIGRRYSGTNAAADKLQRKVKNGSGGVWGTTPMPPNEIPNDQARTLVDWILTLPR